MGFQNLEPFCGGGRSPNMRNMPKSAGVSERCSFAIFLFVIKYLPNATAAEWHQNF